MLFLVGRGRSYFREGRRVKFFGADESRPDLSKNKNAYFDGNSPSKMEMFIFFHLKYRKMG